VTKEGTLIYFARKHDCDACALKPKCCPNMPARKIARSVHEAARDKARAIAKTEAYAVSRRERKKVEMLFAHLKRILGLGKLRLRGPSGAKDEFLLAATAQNLRKLAKIIPFPEPIFATQAERPGFATLNSRPNPHRRGYDNGFFNGIRPLRPSGRRQVFEFDHWRSERAESPPRLSAASMHAIEIVPLTMIASVSPSLRSADSERAPATASRRIL
jgi:hypothetical protein